MSYTNDLATPVGKVRLLIPDVKPGKMRYCDEDIVALLELEMGMLKGAAALALETMASHKAAAVGYVETNAIKLDGSKPADILLKRAKLLREQCAVVVIADEAEDEDEWEFTDLSEWN